MQSGQSEARELYGIFTGTQSAVWTPGQLAADGEKSVKEASGDDTAKRKREVCFRLTHINAQREIRCSLVPTKRAGLL